MAISQNITKNITTNKPFMSLTASKPAVNKQYEPVPAGTHVARLYRIVEIGTVEGEWMGEVKKSKKVWLTFELPNETKVFKEEDGPKPLVISAEFSLTMGPKSKLRPIVEGMIGTTLKDEEAYNFDVLKLVGQPCLVNVTHTHKGDRVYANVASTSPLLKGMEAPAQVNPSKILTYQKWDDEVYAGLPSFIKDKMATTPEMANRNTPEENAKIKEIKEQLIKAQAAHDDQEDIDVNNIPF